MKTTHSIAAGCALLVALASVPFAQGGVDARHEVRFDFLHTPPNAAREVFVVGSLPELGGDDVRRALRMLSDDGGHWELAVSLPVNRTFTYRYVERSTLAQDLGDPDNGVFLAPVLSDKTRHVVTGGKSVQVLTDLNEPWLQWRQGDGEFRRRRLSLLGAGRTEAEHLWGAADIGRAGEAIELFLTDSRARRDPADVTLTTILDRMFLQDGAMYTYVPSDSVSPPRRDYVQGSPPSIFSSLLQRERTYRVMLPRGYDQHTERRYPVLYLYDGDVMWDAGGQSWDRDGGRFRALTDSGAIGEMILVAVDPEGAGSCPRTRSRVRDTVSPEDTVPLVGCGIVTGEADFFVGFVATELKPWIDATYRTRPEREFTFAAGGSLGGVYAMYSGWEFDDVFGAIAAQSGSFWVPRFTARVIAEDKRNIRVYLDFGDQEVPAITDTVRGVRNGLLAKAPGFVLADDLWMEVGYGQPHTFADFGRRMGPMLRFLYPATREVDELSFPKRITRRNAPVR